MRTRTMREICPSFEKKHRLKSLEKMAVKPIPKWYANRPLCLEPAHGPYADISPIRREYKDFLYCFDQKNIPAPRPGRFLLDCSNHQFSIEAFNLNEFRRGKARLGEPISTQGKFRYLPEAAVEFAPLPVLFRNLDHFCHGSAVIRVTHSVIHFLVALR